MPHYCQSTYCSNVVKYCQESKRTVHVVNLDPAAEEFSYHPEVGMGPCTERIHMDTSFRRCGYTGHACLMYYVLNPAGDGLRISKMDIYMGQHLISKG